jgi:glyceraldehyde-3-phosphate dehydrogenase [NAD(P)+]
MKKLHLELGGKAAALILPDANLERAAKECAKGAFRNSGQRCDAISRLLIHEEVADRFIELLLVESAKYHRGDLRDPTTQIGPLIDLESIKHVDRLVQEALTKGAKLLAGGRFEGLFYEPTLLDHVTEEMAIAHEEIFGPVIPLIRYTDINEAVRLSNTSRFGLDSCLFTENLNLAIDISKRLEDGSVTINGAPAHGVGHFPFGGNKESGIGREGLGYSIDEMTKIHTIVFSIKPRK